MLTKVRQRNVASVLGNNKLAVLATVTGPNVAPESSVVAFAEDEDLAIYVQAKCHARKVANMSICPFVSLVIGWNVRRPVTVQVEGVARRVIENQEHLRAVSLFVDKRSPSTRGYFKDPSCVVFCIMPTWIRYSDYRPPHAWVWECDV